MLLENKLIIIMTVINIDTAIIPMKEDVFAVANGRVTTVQNFVRNFKNLVSQHA